MAELVNIWSKTINLFGVEFQFLESQGTLVPTVCNGIIEVINMLCIPQGPDPAEFCYVPLEKVVSPDYPVPYKESHLLGLDVNVNQLFENEVSLNYHFFSEILHWA